jgi:hypothetical protein
MLRNIIFIGTFNNIFLRILLYNIYKVIRLIYMDIYRYICVHQWGWHVCLVDIYYLLIVYSWNYLEDKNSNTKISRYLIIIKYFLFEKYCILVFMET